MGEIFSDNMKRGSLLYTLEAALEYLISILVAGSFLATLTKELGISDSLTGLMSSVISLGCLFQLLSLYIRPKQEKSFVLLLSILNQLFFMLLYVVPFTGFRSQTKIVLFVVLIFSAYILYNIAHPKKTDWLMSFIENSHRGELTANREVISLLSGMVFSFGMGCVVDYFSEVGKIRTAFVISAATIFVLMLLHSFTMLFTPGRPTSSQVKISFRRTLPELFRDKNPVRVTVVFILYYISTYASTPFYGTYQINELGLSLKFVSAITICGSIARILVSRFWGGYADKKSFAAMLIRCFLFLGLAQLCVIFTVPSNGKLMFALYYILLGIAMGGISSALTNLIFDYVPAGKRADSLAITQSLSGFTGFLTTLCISPLVSCIQENGNSLFGLPIFAQQVVSIIALAFTILAILYTRRVFIKRKSSR